MTSASTCEPCSCARTSVPARIRGARAAVLDALVPIAALVHRRDNLHRPMHDTDISIVHILGDAAITTNSVLVLVDAAIVTSTIRGQLRREARGWRDEGGLISSPRTASVRIKGDALCLCPACAIPVANQGTWPRTAV